MARGVTMKLEVVYRPDIYDAWYIWLYCARAMNQEEANQDVRGWLSEWSWFQC